MILIDSLCLASAGLSFEDEMSCDTVLVPPSLDDTWNFVNSALSPRVAWCQVLLLHRFATPEVEWKYAWLKCFWREGLRNIIKNIQECDMWTQQSHSISWHFMSCYGMARASCWERAKIGKFSNWSMSFRRWLHKKRAKPLMAKFSSISAPGSFCRFCRFARVLQNKIRNKRTAKKKKKTLEKLGELFKKIIFKHLQIDTSCCLLSLILWVLPVSQIHG